MPYEDRNGPLLKGNPFLDGPAGTGPGWFAAVEVDPAWVHVGNQLVGLVSFGNITDRVELPTSNLAVTVTPRFEVGYRFHQGSGEVLASYRFVETAGSGDLGGLTPVGGTAPVRSRFDLNVLDLDYASREFPFAMGPGWDMKWLVGVRLASLYFDSQASAAGLSQRETNHFGGAGPQAGVELWRFLGHTGLSLFGRLDFDFFMGRVRQSFTETVGSSGAETDLSQIQGAPVLAIQFGLAWMPDAIDNFRVAAGYTFERWWDIGLVDQSRAQATVQGIFVRGEWRY
jgi:hypothetical protein